MYLWKQGPFHRYISTLLTTTGTCGNIKYPRQSLTPIQGSITVCNLLSYVMLLLLLIDTMTPDK